MNKFWLEIEINDKYLPVRHETVLWLNKLEKTLGNCDRKQWLISPQRWYDMFWRQTEICYDVHLLFLGIGSNGCVQHALRRVAVNSWIVRNISNRTSLDSRRTGAVAVLKDCLGGAGSVSETDWSGDQDLLFLLVRLVDSRTERSPSFRALLHV